MKIKKTIYSKSPWIDHIPLTIVYDLPKIIKDLGGSAWHPYYKDINKKAVKDAHDNNLPVNVWTVNDEDDMLKMIEYGCLLYTSPSPRDATLSRMPSSA